MNKRMRKARNGLAKPLAHQTTQRAAKMNKPNEAKKIQYRQATYTLVKHGEVSNVRPRGDEWILARHEDGRLMWLPACDCYPAQD